jgi:hypothetical protein
MVCTSSTDLRASAQTVPSAPPRFASGLCATLRVSEYEHRAELQLHSPPLHSLPNATWLGLVRSHCLGANAINIEPALYPRVGDVRITGMHAIGSELACRLSHCDLSAVWRKTDGDTEQRHEHHVIAARKLLIELTEQSVDRTGLSESAVSSGGA